MKTLHERIKNIRENMTQANFSIAFGIPLTTIGRYERGDNRPDLAFLEAISSKFNISLDWLIFGVGEMKLSEKRSAKENSATCANCMELLTQLNNSRVETIGLQCKLLEQAEAQPKKEARQPSQATAPDART